MSDGIPGWTVHGMTRRLRRANSGLGSKWAKLGPAFLEAQQLKIDLQHDSRNNVTGKKLADRSVTPSKLDSRVIGGSVRHWIRSGSAPGPPQGTVTVHKRAPNEHRV